MFGQPDRHPIMAVKPADSVHHREVGSFVMFSERSMKGLHSDGRVPVSERARTVLLASAAVILLAVTFAAGAATVWFIDRRSAEPPVGSATNAAAVTSEPTSSTDQATSLLQETLSILEEEYLEPEALVPEEVARGAAAGAVGVVDDPYTVFVDPLPAAIMDEDMQGTFEGIGATVSMVGERLVIQELLDGSPAIAAGLQVGDAILEVDGKPLAGLDVVAAISMIRGPRGSVVRLLVEREGLEEPFLVPVTRARVEMPTVEYRMLDGDVAYLRLTEFNGIASRKVREALRDLLKAKPQGMILDLRDNPGGYFQTAIDVASEFLEVGQVVVSERIRDQEPEIYKVTRRGLATDVPLVVLVNGGSASAAEIVAGAIRDNGRGTLIGETTYGKGSVQNVHTLSDGSSLRVTVARYYLPSGDNLDGQGLEPDVAVGFAQEDIDAGRDPQLDRAVEFLTRGG